MSPSAAASTDEAAAVAVAHLPNGVLLARDGAVVLVNDAFCAMTGLERAALVGGPLPRVPSRGPARAGRRTTLDVVRTPVPRGLLLTVTERPAREAELERLAHLDGLTGLLNHRAFRRRLEAEAGRLAAHGRPLSLVMLDLDRFKAVNDVHGHPAGDRVLAETARRLQRAARAGDLVARLGGEEFAWLLPDAAVDEALEAAERLRAAVGDRPFGPGLDVTVSIGVYEPAARDGADALLDRADRALYWAKAAGRDTVVPWTPEVAARLTPALRAGVTADALVAIADGMDPGHGARVADLAVALAACLDWSPVRQGRLHLAARLHDLGKAALLPGVLRSGGPLTPVQRAHVHRHPAMGAALAAPVLDGEQRDWIAGHHERWDGRGYPAGAARESVAQGAQILALADAWDAMTHARPYRRALAPAEALDEVRRGAGGQFRPDAPQLIEGARRWWSAA